MNFLKRFIVIILVSMSVLNASSCFMLDQGYVIKEKKYYSNKNNFVSVTATCVEVVTNERFPDQYVIIVKDMRYDKMSEEQFVSVNFKVGDENSEILRKNKIEEKLAPGVLFAFTSAPKYFGDGYMCPIVEVVVNGETLLDFDTGYDNLMKEY